MIDINSAIEQLVLLAGHIAWPITLGMILWVLRQPIRQFFEIIAKRASDPRSDIKLGTDGISIVSNLAAKLQDVDMRLETLADMAVGNSRKQAPADGASTSQSNDIHPGLMDLATKYLNVREPNWTARVLAKDDIARRMAEFVLSRNVNRDLLVQRYENQGLLLALAAAIHAYPTVGDDNRILRLVDEATGNYLRYRIVLAIGRLVERGFITKHHRDKVMTALRSYESIDDASLKRRIMATKAIIEERIQ